MMGERKKEDELSLGEKCFQPFSVKGNIINGSKK